MKLNKYIWLAALPMIFTACQENELVENQQDNIYTLSAQMDDGKAMSRAQIQFGNENAEQGEIFYWNTGDNFKMYQSVNGSLKTTEFTINSGYKEPTSGSQTTATFVSATPAAGGVKYVAIYPGKVPVNENNDANFNFQEELDFTNATTPEAKTNVWKEYFKNNMFMKAEGTLTADGNNTLTFRHMCALARVTYVNATNETQTVNGIRLGGNQTFGTSHSFRVTGGSSGSGGTNSYELKTKGLNVAAGESMDFYVFFFPREFANGEMHVTVMEKGHLALATSRISEANNGATGFEAGKRYWFKVTQTNEGMKWTNSLTDEPGGDKESGTTLPSWDKENWGNN